MIDKVVSDRTNEELRQDPSIIEPCGQVLDRYPDHEIVQVKGIVRWKPKQITLILHDLLKANDVSTHTLWEAYDQGRLPVEELAQYYRETGYTLGGFMQLF